MMQISCFFLQLGVWSADLVCTLCTIGCKFLLPQSSRCFLASQKFIRIWVLAFKSTQAKLRFCFIPKLWYFALSPLVHNECLTTWELMELEGRYSTPLTTPKRHIFLIILLIFLSLEEIEDTFPLPSDSKQGKNFMIKSSKSYTNPVFIHSSFSATISSTTVKLHEFGCKAVLTRASPWTGLMGWWAKRHFYLFHKF